MCELRCWNIFRGRCKRLQRLLGRLLPERSGTVNMHAMCCGTLRECPDCCSELHEVPFGVVLLGWCDSDGVRAWYILRFNGPFHRDGVSGGIILHGGV